MKLYLVGDYSIQDFLVTWDPFVANQGATVSCSCQQNPAMEMTEYVLALVINFMKKTVWHFVPAQVQFRNGAVEFFVKKLKKEKRS